MEVASFGSPVIVIPRSSHSKSQQPPKHNVDSPPDTHSPRSQRALSPFFPIHKAPRASNCCTHIRHLDHAKVGISVKVCGVLVRSTLVPQESFTCKSHPIAYDPLVLYFARQYTRDFLHRNHFDCINNRTRRENTRSDFEDRFDTGPSIWLDHYIDRQGGRVHGIPIYHPRHVPQWRRRFD